MNKLPLLLLILLPVQILIGVTVDYDIKSLGIRVASISVNTQIQQRYVEVKAKSIHSNALFPHIDNVYKVTFNEQFLPNVYVRKVRQGELSDDVKVIYNHSALRAAAVHSGKLGEYGYAIAADTRDFFSFMVYLAQGKISGNQFSIDGNGSLWTASVTKEGRELLKTPLGDYSCSRYSIRFNPVTNQKMNYVDMVTHNLLSRSSRLTLWISDGGNAMKAVIRKGALSMSWEIKGISP